MTPKGALPPGAPIWIDLACDDIMASQVFYSHVLGWFYQPTTENAGGWTMATVDGLPVAGMAPRRSDTPKTWSMYFGVGDVDATLGAVAELGGTVLVPGFDIVIDGVCQGRIAAATDPTGAAFGLWQPDAMLCFSASGERGLAQWFELNSQDPATAVDFYCQLFCATATDIADPAVPGYTSITIPGSAHENFAIWSMPDMLPTDAASQWFTYFAVRDVDAAARRVVAGGGSVMMTQDSPHGRWCFATGTQGEPFYLIDVTVKSG